MDVDPADPAAAGLSQVVATLCRQLDVTRKQVLSLQKLKEKKETLLQTGYTVLQQHCAAASLGPDAQFQSGNLANNFQASVTGLTPCPSGWKVSVQVQGSSELLNNLDITITATLPGTGIHGCIIRQLEESPLKTSASAATVAAGATASALIELQGFPLKVNTITLEVYALLKPSSLDSSSLQPGVLSAAVHAGRITLDRTAWLHSFSRSLDEREKRKGDDEEHITRWPCAAHFSVEIQINMNEFDINWLDTFLVQQLGCLSVGEATWSLGNTAEVQSSFEQYNSTSITRNSTVLPISIYGESMQIVWTIQEELKSQLEMKIVSAHHSGILPDSTQVAKWIQTPHSSTNKRQKKHRNSNIKSIKAGADALLSELDSLTTWTEALKKQDEAGNSILARQHVLVAQAAAVEAMIHTDSSAIAVACNHNLN